MLFSWIVRTIPRSVRAFLALLIVVGSLALLISALPALFVPGDMSMGNTMLRVMIGLALGVPATIVFYYFQANDERHRHKGELDTMTDRADSEQRRRYAESVTRPVAAEQNRPFVEGETVEKPPGNTDRPHN